MKKYTQILSDYLCGLRYEQIPPEVIERAKILSLHTLGVAISAHKCQRAQEIIAVAKAMAAPRRFRPRSLATAARWD